MKRVHLIAALLPVLSLAAVACSSEPSGTATPGAGPSSGADGTQTGTDGTPEGAASDGSSLDAACDSAFDAMLARTAKCGSGSTMGLVPVERSRPGFKKLCAIQGSRPGTGYTAAFRAKCAEVLATADCADDDVVVQACWEPRGKLARGLPCNTDDQCQDGLCELPSGAKSGSSCGVCSTPVWKHRDERCDKSDKDKCEPATLCKNSSDTSDCSSVIGLALGADCSSGSCRDGLTCKNVVDSGKDYRCVEGPRRAAAGEACSTTYDGTHCQPGTACSSKGVCVTIPTLGEPAGTTTYQREHCDSWTTESATGKCLVEAALSCN
ncbi:hypothetical protein BH11MYX4_BH11MYX4_54760 [soil metagenome]